MSEWLSVVDRMRAEGWELALVDGWVCWVTTECTCSPHFGAHERHCGIEPEMRAAEWMTFDLARPVVSSTPREASE